MFLIQLKFTKSKKIIKNFEHESQKIGFSEFKSSSSNNPPYDAMKMNLFIQKAIRG